MTASRAVGLAAALGLLAAQAAAAEGCSEDRLDLRGPWGAASFRVEVADTPETRARGLMFREDLSRSEGMLFAYERPGPVSFWMRNTLIPLDMVFMSPEGVVTRIHENAVPGDETPIPGGDGVQFVLEVPGGLADVLGMTVGTEARHPALGDDAAWACDPPPS